MASPSRSSQASGFTLVEVLIAMIILAMVVGASASAVAVSTHTTNKSKIVSRQREVANAVLHRATANTNWLTTYNCGMGVCTAAINAYVPPTDPLLDEPDGTVKHVVAFTATGIDRADDGIGASDSDQVIPDAFRLEVTDTVTAPGVIAVPLPVYTASGVIDMSVRGHTGTLRIQTCRVFPQIDERLGTGLCHASGASTFDVQATTPCPAARFECTEWNSAVATGDPKYTRINVAPFAGIGMTIKGPLPGSGIVYNVTTNASGTAYIRDLKPGQYRILSTSPPAADPYWTTWKTHSVPSGDYVTVEAGTIHDATMLMKPTVSQPVIMNVDAQDITDPINILSLGYARSRATVKLIPIPNGRANLSRGPNEGYTVVFPGNDSATLEGVEPGLYSMQLLHFPGSTISSLSAPGNNFVWIPPGYQGSATVPASIRYLQQYCDAGVRHSHVQAICPSWQRFCWYGSTNLLVTECQNDTTYTPIAAAGDGGA